MSGKLSVDDLEFVGRKLLVSRHVTTSFSACNYQFLGKKLLLCRHQTSARAAAPALSVQSYGILLQSLVQQLAVLEEEREALMKEETPFFSKGHLEVTFKRKSTYTIFVSA